MVDPRLTEFATLNIGFLSLSSEPGIDDLLVKIKTGSLKLNCVFTKLKSKDLQAYEPQANFDGVVLLHSISQGRNSITDVADARYSKLLPQLNQRYGSHRVGVVVHSLSSYNPATKDALMMVFRKSQPTCFKCSNCVIQCGKLEEIPESELARLVGFLEEVRNHPLPTATKGVEVTPTQATQMRHHKAMDVGRPIPARPFEPKSSNTHGASKSKMSEVSHKMGGSFERTQDTKIMKTDLESACNTPEGSKDESTTLQAQLEMTAHETDQTTLGGDRTQTTGNTESRRDLYPHEHSYDSDMTSAVGGAHKDRTELRGGIPTPLGSTSRDEKDLVHPLMSSKTADGQPQSSTGGGASGVEDPSKQPVTPTSSSSGELHQVNPSSSCYGPTAAPVLETTYPVALIVIPTSTATQETEAAVKKILPGKTIIPYHDLSPFRNNWHLFEAFLIDIGITPITAKTPVFSYVQEIRHNIGNPQNVAVLTQNQSEGNSAPISCQAFAYNTSHGSSSVVFDERTTRNFQMWMRDCHQRFVHSLSDPQMSWRAKGAALFKSMMNR